MEWFSYYKIFMNFPRKTKKKNWRIYVRIRKRSVIYFALFWKRYQINCIISKCLAATHSSVRYAASQCLVFIGALHMFIETDTILTKLTIEMYTSILLVLLPIISNSMAYKCQNLNYRFEMFIRSITSVYSASIIR